MGMRSKFFFFIYDTLLFFFLFLMMFYDDITTILSHYFPGLAALCVQWGLMARLTWWEYSWDVMEPISVRNLIFIFFFFFPKRKEKHRRYTYKLHENLLIDHFFLFLLMSQISILLHLELRFSVMHFILLHRNPLNMKIQLKLLLQNDKLNYMQIINLIWINGLH